MLQPATVLPGSRRSLRRAVRLEAELASTEWEHVRPHRVLDLSPEGMQVAAGTRLGRGESLVVSFTPPGWWLHGELSLFAEVVRSTPRIGEEPASMGLSFLDMPHGAREELARCLRGRPPPLPRRRHRPRRELVWVDCLVTWEEDLGDRVNVVEWSETVAAEEIEAAIDPTPIGGLLTGGRRPYRWRHAA